MSLSWLFETESNLMFSLENQTVWIVVTVCATVILLVKVIVARCIYLRRHRQRSLEKVAKRHRRRPGQGKAYNKQVEVGWGLRLGWRLRVNIAVNISHQGYLSLLPSIEPFSKSKICFQMVRF